MALEVINGEGKEKDNKYIELVTGMFDIDSTVDSIIDSFEDYFENPDEYKTDDNTAELYFMDIVDSHHGVYMYFKAVNEYDLENYFDEEITEDNALDYWHEIDSLWSEIASALTEVTRFHVNEKLKELGKEIPNWTINFGTCEGDGSLGLILNIG